MFINGCSCCGKCGCQCGKLPFTMTVHLSGFTNRAKGNFCDLAISSNYGGGAAGVAEKPGGCDGNADPLCYDCNTQSYAESDRDALSGVILTEPGSCYARLARTAPTLSARNLTGSGAKFAVTLSKHTDNLGLSYWSVESVAVTGGAGYQPETPIEIVSALGDVVEQAAIVQLQAIGGVPTVAWVIVGGKYYREDTSLPGSVAEISISACGGGVGAVISAVVDDNAKSSTFGQITALSVTNGGGKDYLAWRWTDTCRTLLNGQTFILRASEPEELTKLLATSCFGSGFCGRIVPVGKTETICDGGIELTYEYANEKTGVKAVEIISAGSGYAVLGRDEPKLSLEVTGDSLGSKAEFTVVLESDEDSCGIKYWTIKAVNVDYGGQCYGLTARSAPTIELALPELSGGEGLTILIFGVQGAQDDCGASYWYVSFVTVDSGGSGYTDGERLEVVVTDGHTEVEAEIIIHTVDQEDGPQGVVESIEVANGGKYYKQLATRPLLDVVLQTEDDKEEIPAILRANTSDGIITSVDIIDSGKYYREDKNLPPYTNTKGVTVIIDQAEGSYGCCAEILATVDTDPYSSSFGQIVELKIDKEGQEYTLYGGPKNCSYYGPCGMTLTFRGPGKEPEFTLGDAVYRSNGFDGNCNQLPNAALLLHSEWGGEAEIEPDGKWDSLAPCPCDGQCARWIGDPCLPPPPNQCQPCVGTCGGCDWCEPGCECEGGACVPKNCYCISQDVYHYPNGGSFRCRLMRDGVEISPSGGFNDVWVNEIPYGYLTIGGGFGPCLPPGDGYGPIFTWKENYPAALNSACGFILVWETVTTTCSGLFTVPVNGDFVTVFVGLARGKGRLRMFLPNCEDLTLEEVDITEVADWAVDENGDPVGLYFGCTGSGTGFSYDTGVPQCPEFDNGCPCQPAEPEFPEGSPVTIECGIGI